MIAFARKLFITALGLAFLSTAAPAQLLDDAIWFEREVGDGVVWRYYQFDDLFSSKQSISYMEINLAEQGVGVDINYREGVVGPDPAVYPRARTSVMAAEIPGSKAAINGTFFNTSTYKPGSPDAVWGGGVTYLKVDGTTIHPFDGSNINTSGVGLLYDDVTNLEITRRPAGGWSSIDPMWQNMMICGPMLVENGVIETYDAGNTFAHARHPRSAIGLTGDNKLILLAVDGRTGDAAGMSCTELAQVIKELGAVDAMNLDGGGSTTLWASGEPFNGVVNYPSDNSAYDHLGERSAANALIVTAGEPAATAWDGRLNSLVYSTLARSGSDYTVEAVYTNTGTETWTDATVSIIPSRDFGRNSAFIPSGEEDTFYTMSPSSVPPGSQAAFTLNLTPPEVATDTVFSESFALSHATEGYFGPADNALRLQVTIRPKISGAPPTMIVQGTPTGPNNQWYFETSGGWGNSSVSFTAPGVSNSGTQRYCSTTSLGRSAEFRPIFDANGIYSVEVSFPPSTNNINNVQYTVNDLNGSATFTMNQHSSAGLTDQWNLLGNFNFSDEASGEAGVHSIVVGNPNSSTSGNRFYSGAVRLDYQGPLPGKDDWQIY